ncbi:Predicted arabinose efflux permease, MFS family [Actinopolyspora lacussalsi subsp. righensis]|uniref:Predicted arabinose efflux permease, MFS family n=1 Tax=Actinopolyspora righensis TaxID=995060 RepID=A0A1I6X865_9ACTN|nr:MFS transporter [Actinopolyspora righensis]SFT34447.1 Predicted arabinose efflux permease, MFS family [Actinopolyspora righensis]
MGLSARLGIPGAFWLLWWGQVVNRLGMLVPAFVVLYVRQEGVVSPSVIPVMVGLFGGGVLVSSVVGGVLADVLGNRRVILGAQPVAMITAVGFVLAQRGWMVCGLALLAGFVSMIDRPASAGAIARLVPAERFARAYGIHMVGFNVGMSVGPVVAGFVLAFWPPLLFGVWAGCALIYAGLVWWLPADEPTGTAGSSKGYAALVGLVEPFRRPALVLFLVLTFLLGCVYLQMNSSLPVDMRASGLDPTRIGAILAVNAVLAIVLVGVVPRVLGGWREHTPLVLAAVLVAVGFGLNGFASGTGMFVAATVVWTLGEVVWAPMSAAFIAGRAPAGRVATYQGSYFLAWNAAFVVGGPLGLALGQSYGFTTLWSVVLVVGLVTAAGFLALPLLSGLTSNSSRSGESVVEEPQYAETS